MEKTTTKPTDRKKPKTKQSDKLTYAQVCDMVDELAERVKAAKVGLPD